MNQNETTTVADEIAGMEGLKVEEEAEETAALDGEAATVLAQEETTETEGADDETGNGEEGEVLEEGEEKEADEAAKATAEAEESKREAEDLRQQVDYLTRTMKTLTDTIAEQTSVDAPKFEIEASDFVASDEEYDAAMQSKEGLNAVLNKAAEYGASKAVEHSLKDLPKTIQSRVMEVVDNAVMIHMFFRDNKDLRSIGDAEESYHVKVANVYRALEKKYPAKKAEQLFGLLAGEVRKVHKVASTKTVKTPIAAETGKGKTRKQATAPKKQSIADEIAVMEDAG